MFKRENGTIYIHIKSLTSARQDGRDVKTSPVKRDVRWCRGFESRCDRVHKWAFLIGAFRSATKLHMLGMKNMCIKNKTTRKHVSPLTC